MNKFSKLALATLLAMTSVAAVGCSQKEETKPAATTEDKKEDETKINRAVFAAALIAENNLIGQFHAAAGLNADGTEYAYYEAPNVDEAVSFLSKYWDAEVAKKEIESYLVDATKLAEVNKAAEAQAKADEAEFTALTAAGDADKIGTNDISSAKAQFADAKVSKDGDKFVVEYKGLKYTLTAEGTSYKVVGKEGTLAQ